MNGRWGWFPWGFGAEQRQNNLHTHTPTPKAAERLRKAIADPPSRLGFPCRISRPSQEMAGQPYKSTSRRSRERRDQDRDRAAVPARCPRGCSEGTRASPSECPSGGSGSQSRVPCHPKLGPGGVPSGSGDTSAPEGEPRSRHRVGQDRAATASKPVTQLRRVIPGLLIIDFEWEETGSALVGRTRVRELISLLVLPGSPVPCGAGELGSTPWDRQPGKALPGRGGGLAGRCKGREVQGQGGSRAGRCKVIDPREKKKKKNKRHR